MTDDGFDAELRGAAESLVTVRVLPEPHTGLSSRPPRFSVGAPLLVAAAILGVALTPLVIGRGQTVAADVGAGRLLVTANGDELVLVLDRDESSESLIVVPIRRPFAVRELLCQIRLSDRRLVLFGVAPEPDSLRVLLDGEAVAGTLEGSRDGSFLFVSDADVRPGPMWTVVGSGNTASGHVPGVGDRSADGLDPNYCFAYDGSVEGSK